MSIYSASVTEAIENRFSELLVSLKVQDVETKKNVNFRKNGVFYKTALNFFFNFLRILHSALYHIPVSSLQLLPDQPPFLYPPNYVFVFSLSLSPRPPLTHTHSNPSSKLHFFL